MRGGERLGAADAGNHLEAKCNPSPCRDVVEDTDRRIVEGRIAPDEEGAAPLPVDLRHDQRFINVRALFVPGADAAEIVPGIPLPFRTRRRDNAVAWVADETPADLLANADQVRRRRTLVHEEENIGAVERLDRLDGHVVGISRADTDDENSLHSFRPKVTAGIGPKGNIARRPLVPRGGLAELSKIQSLVQVGTGSSSGASTAPARYSSAGIS